jgi:hypothetical protein
VNGEVHYSSGQWHPDISEESSHFRELATWSIEDAYGRGSLKNAEVFLFTDNSTVDLAFYNATPSSKALFELVFMLQSLQMHKDIIIHFVHVAGK